MSLCRFRTMTAEKRDLLMHIYDGLKAIDPRYNPVVTLDHQM